MLTVRLTALILGGVIIEEEDLPECQTEDTRECEGQGQGGGS